MYQGYSSFSGTGLDTAVTGEPVQVAPLPGVNCWAICTNFELLAEFFSVSNRISGSEFILDSVDATSSFLNSFHITESSVTVAINCSASVQETGTNYKLSGAGPTAEKLAQFIATNGDRFVTTIVRGVQYIACYVFYAVGVAEQSKVSDRIKAAFSDDEGGSVNDDFATNFKRALKENTTRTSFLGLLTDPKATPPTDYTQIWSLVQQINDDTAKTGAVLGYSGVDYEDVGLLGLIDATSLRTNRAIYTTLAGYADALLALQARFQTVQTAYDAYRYTGDSTFEKVAKAVSDDLGLVQSEIQELAGSPLDVFAGSVDEPSSLSEGIPQLNFVLSYDTTFGGGSGPGAQVTSFDSAIIYGGNALKSIAINGGSEVNYLLLQYGSLELTHLGSEDSGGAGTSQTLTLGEGERWESLSAHAGALVNQLTVTPSVQQPLTWPVHARSAQQFDWSPPEGYVLAGFGASYDSGDHVALRTLTPVAVKFSPAKGLTSKAN